MLLYRVFPHVAGARAGQPGHALYVNPLQGKSRFDNPSLYLAWYMASEASSAVGESFAGVRIWTDAMFSAPFIAGARRALGIYQLPDDMPYVDLDDPQQLLTLGVRPSQVVERNRPYTQALAARIYHQHLHNGIRWWSYHRPQWRIWCLWDIAPSNVQVQRLTTTHPAVQDAATALSKAIT